MQNQECHEGLIKILNFGFYDPNQLGRKAVLSKKQFIIKFIFCFNLYGNLLLLGIALCTGGVVFFIIKAVSFIYAGDILLSALCIMMSAGFLIGAVCCTYWYMEIGGQLKQKYKYYSVTTKRVKKNGFTDEILEDGLDSPCYRLLMRQILSDFSRGKDYKKLKRYYSIIGKNINTSFIDQADLSDFEKINSSLIKT